ncbi:restriction endonuclease subunit S [Falsigemmobacter intermedius]|uniref:Restriction endonuclease subunit S n=1 Tax=Falsigemmobacter intermedius TaxID=1553448 RepID=A0A3S3VNF6_9RHOB|nr:restriction endonuclease subunit S [Falsigemmobacter intermedius]RWY39475.1 restriction endonuclease subunit S [Falsigemmobacter intermedius]
MKAYPEYKYSGVEWLGEVPAGWEVSRFKNHLHERDERSEDGDETLLSVSAYTGVRPRSEGIEDGEFLSRAESLQGYKVAYSGDLVMNIMLAWNRAQGITDFNGIVSPAYAVFKLNSSIFPAYLNHLVRTDEYCRYFKAFSAGVIDSRLRLYPEKFGGLFAIIPPLTEQRKIAAFLDREVAKIDDLIEEQRRLIALLAEKRQATISHAVTKGLNPNAKLKPSGIDWLGDVPEGWEVIRLSRMTSQIVDGAHFTPTYVSEGVPFLRVTDISRGFPDLETVARIPLEEHLELIKRCHPRKGDLLLSKNGTVGVPMVITWDWDFSIFVSLCLIRLNRELSAEFAKYVFLSKQIEMQIEADKKQSTVINLHLEKIAGFMFPCPSLPEQEEVVQFLDRVTQKFDSLSNAAVAAISLLQERRSALISAAVTGKIDLRDFDDSILE